MSTFQTHRRSERPVAVGTIDRHGRMQVAVRFDEEMFEVIRVLAENNGRSFAEQVRVMCRVVINSARADAQSRQ